MSTAKKIKKKQRPINKPTRYKPYESPFGRPTTYDPKYAEIIFKEMASGLPLQAACAAIGEYGITKETAYEWRKKHQEFADAIKLGRVKGMKELLRQGSEMQNNCANKSAFVWDRRMTNIYGWNKKDEKEDDDDFEGLSFREY